MTSFAGKIRNCLNDIKRGDAKRFDDLYQMTFYHLLGLAKYYLTDKSYAEDVVLESYEKIYRYIDTYEDGESGYSWMCKIVQNTAYFYNEISKKERKLKGELESSHQERAAPDTDARLDLYTAIEKLDEQDRELAYSYFFFDKKLKDIAAELGMTSSGVKKRINKLIKILKKFLENG